ncbi:hypothetical protein ACQEU8_09015 [Streptomyces sp. CA-250714]|uniref:ParB/RepB/Spo0J family partition protein n=1 Tax=Streptomyces sp. CA-250714 TaxID=3240060 RepID=UPI003D8C8724
MSRRSAIAARRDREPDERPVGPLAAVALDELLASDSPRLNGEDTAHIRALAALEAPLPPILVHRGTMRIIDGMHRMRAARLRGENRIQVEFFEGGEDEVFALSVKLNITHGLPLSQADRKAAAKRIIEAHPYWSDRRIAANAGLAASTVATIRRRSTGRNAQLNVRVGRDGRVRPLHATEGRLRASKILAANPEASLRQIAEEAGIATATAKDVRDRIRQGQDPVPPRLQAAALARRGAVASVTADQGGSAGTTAGAGAGAAAGTGTATGSAPRLGLGPGAGAVADAMARLGAGVAAPRTSPAALDAVLANMRRDPALRTDAGRLLLQLLSAHAIGDEVTWQRLARSVPVHRAETLAQAARRCADHWLRFAKWVETRSP